MADENKKSYGMWSAILNGAGNALSSVLDFFGTKATNEANERNVRATNEMNYKIAQESNAEQMRRLLATQNFDVDQWNRNNQYNSFSAQMQRARDAGLNPQSIVQNTPSTQVTSQNAPTPVSPTMQAFQEMPNSWRFGDVINRVTERLDKLFEQRQILRDDKRRAAEHQLDMMIKGEEYIHAVKGNMFDRSYADKRKAEAEADDAVNQVVRNQERHSKDMAKTDADIRAINKGIDKTENDIRLDNERLDLEKAAAELEKRVAEAGIKLNKAQIASVYNAIQMAKNADKRANEIHDKDKRAKQLANDLQEIKNMFESQKIPAEAMLQMIMTNNEIFHENLKHDSEINKILERVFGFGFRDVGGALSNFAKILK